MAVELLLIFFAVVFCLTFFAWKRYLWVVNNETSKTSNTCEFSLSDEFGSQHLIKIPHQKNVEWLDEVFARSAAKFPHHTALQIPLTGESLTFSELDALAETVAAAVIEHLSGPDQVVAVAMTQDNPEIVACHLGILKAGGVALFFDPTLPDVLVAHMLEDANPAVILTRGQTKFKGRQSLDVLELPSNSYGAEKPGWLDDPTQRLATIFYTSGTTGRPKGVECHHAGYVNLALSYADYFDLVPGVDATSLSSSMAYDGSISEMYSAWVSGCSVVMLTKEEIRSGPDLLPVLCETEVTVLFCPPALLSTLTQSPELDLPYPICRYVVPAGEAFPNTLVEPWTRGRRQIINTYGPTEACTDTSRQSLRPGEAITIGSPFANVKYVILKLGELTALPHGEVGELCIGGIHVARGYRNSPELTAQKFIDHPQFGRLYRTGDKCRIDVNLKRVHYLGRVDTQLKVRGHRVEVQAVEDILLTKFKDIENAVVDYQNQELVAFVKASSISENPMVDVVPAPNWWVSRVRSILSEDLPVPSIPTRYFLVDKFIMKPVSGKIDREQLPSINRLPKYNSESTRDTGGFVRLDQTEDEIDSNNSSVSNNDKLIVNQKVLEICRKVLGNSLELDDVFADNGGHSIVIAQLAQKLQAAGWSVSVRSLLSNCDTARKVANLPQPSRDEIDDIGVEVDTFWNGERDEEAAKVLSVGYFTFLQVLLLFALYLPLLLSFLATVTFGEIGEFFMTAQLWEFIAVGLLMYLVALLFPFIGLLWVLVIKRLIGGHFYKNNITPGAYPKWSRMHLRVWCIERLEASVIRPLGMMFRSPPLMSFTIRQLGAEVGNNVHCAQDIEFSGPLDLLTIEDDVTIQSGAYIHLSSWIGQELHIGPVHLESRCKIGMRAAVANNVRIGKGTWITPLTPILSSVGSNEIWEGAPAELVGRYTELKRPLQFSQQHYSTRDMEIFNILFQLFMEFWLLVVPTSLVTYFSATLIPARDTELASEYFNVTPLLEIISHMGLYTFFTTWTTIVLISVVSCLFIRLTAVTPGLYPSNGFKAALLLYRMKKMNQIQRIWTWTIFGQYLRALAGLRFSRLGASECDFMLNLVPELASTDALVFWSHGCLTNMLDQNESYLVLQQLDMPENNFVSNNSVVEFGRFPTNFLLGVSTPGSEILFRRQMQTLDDIPLTVAGNPPLKFASTDFKLENKLRRIPTFPLFLTRVLLNDIVSIGALRAAGILFYVIFYTVLLRLEGQILISAFLALVLTEVVLILFCAGIKKLLVGKHWGRDHSAQFWSWRHFSYFFAQDCFFVWCRVPLAIFAGTLLPNTILRMMGSRIGKRTILTVPLQVYDWNAVNFGNDCLVAGLLQFHTFENMILKVKETKIQDGSTVNFGATVMGGGVIQTGVTLLPLSLVLKEMNIQSGTYWGSPIEPENGRIRQSNQLINFGTTHVR